MRLWSTITYSENFAGDQIKPCKTALQNCSLQILER